MVSIGEISSSAARLRIASLLSKRPRTLSELATTTGISVQGVLKHLDKLAKAGILSEETIPPGNYLRTRKLYSIKRQMVLDYSEGDLMVAALTEAGGEEDGSRDSYSDLERMAEDLMILERRAREQSRRVRRMVEQVAWEQAAIAKVIEGLGLTPEERQIAYLIFSEDTLDEARRVMREHYGCTKPDEATKRVGEKIRRFPR